MVVDGHAHVPPGLGDALGDLDVGAARLGIARGVVVDEDHRGGADVHRPADHFARMDRGLVDRAVAHVMILDQPVLGVEVEHPYALYRQVRHVGGEVIDQRLPAAEDGLVDDLAAGHAPRGGGDGFESSGAVLADAFDALERLGIGIEHACKAAELGKQRLGERLGIAARDRREQQVFEHLVIGERLRSPGQQPVAKARAVPVPRSLSGIEVWHRFVGKI